MASKAEKRPEYPVEFYQDQNVQCISASSEKFGLNFEGCDVMGMECSSSKSSSEFLPLLDIKTCSYMQLYSRITSTASQLTKQTLPFVNDGDGDCDDTEFTTGTDTPTPTDTDFYSITVSNLKTILIRALTWYHTHKVITSMSETATLRVEHLPFMTNGSNNLFDPVTMELSTDPKEQSEHEARLDHVLKSWNLSRHSVPRDGNCLFFSIAYNLKLQIGKGNTALQQFLEESGIPVHHTLEEIMSTLRILVVAEWLGEHTEEYQAFLTAGQLQEQAKQFLMSGKFSSDVGDLAVAAISNILKAPIVLFTSAPNMPILVQHPTRTPMSNLHPVHVAYTQFGPGHYDTVIPATAHSETSSKQQDDPPSSAGSSITLQHCNCGRKAVKGVPCSFALDQYTCRCPCYNAQQPCSHQCRCKNCSNPFGVRPKTHMKSMVSQKRKRYPHEHQMLPLCGKKSASFMKDVGEPVKIGGFSKMEFLVLCSIVQNILLEDSQTWNCNWEGAKDIDISKIHWMYTSIITLAEALGLDLSLYSRTQEQICKELKSTSFKHDVYYQTTM